MESSCIVHNLISNQNWKVFEDNLNDQMFKEMIKNAINNWNFKENIKNFPDSLIRKLMLTFDTNFIQILVDEYENRFGDIAKELIDFHPEILTKHLYAIMDIVTLLSDDDIISIFSSFINVNDLVCNNDYFFVREALHENHSYTNLNKKNANLQLKNLIVNVPIKRLRSSLREKLVRLSCEMIDNASKSCLEVANILLSAALKIAELVINSFDCISPIRDALIMFPFAEFYPSSIFGFYFESKQFARFSPTDQHTFFKCLGRDKDAFMEEFFIKAVQKEYEDPKSAPTSILKQASKSFFKSSSLNQLRKIQKWSKDEVHPLHDAFERILQNLEDIIFEELIYNGLNYTFKSLIGLIEDAVSRPNFDHICLRFDTVLSMIESIIRRVFTKKEELAKYDANMYNNICIQMMTLMIHRLDYQTSTIYDRPSDPFRSILSFIDPKLRDQLVWECIFHPVSGYSNWTKNGTIVDVLAMALRTTNVCDVGKYFDQHGDSYGFIDDCQSFKIGNLIKNHSTEIVFEGRMSVFETKILSSEFYKSNVKQLFIDGISTYINYLNALFVQGIRQNDIELLNDAIGVHGRIVKILLCKNHGSVLEDQLKILSEVIMSPLSMIAGLRTNKNYIQTISNILNLIPNSPVDVPLILFEYVVQSSYLEGYPEVEEFCSGIVLSLFNLITTKQNNDLYSQIQSPCFPVYWLSTCDYKGLTKEFMDQIEEVSLIGRNNVPLQLLIKEEKENKPIKLLIGKAFNVAVNLLMSYISKSDPKDNIKLKNSLISFLNNLCVLMLSNDVVISVEEEFYRKHLYIYQSIQRTIGFNLDQTTTEFIRNVSPSHPFGYLDSKSIRNLELLNYISSKKQTLIPENFEEKDLNRLTMKFISQLSRKCRDCSQSAKYEYDHIFREKIDVTKNAKRQKCVPADNFLSHSLMVLFLSSVTLHH